MAVLRDKATRQKEDTGNLPISEVISDSEWLLQECRSFAAQEDFLEAADIKRCLEIEVLPRIENAIEAHAAECASAVRRALREEAPLLLAGEIGNQMSAVIASLESREGWDHVSQIDGVATFHRKEADSPIHSFRTEGVVDAHWLQVACLFYEFDLWPSVFPGLTSARKLDMTQAMSAFVQQTVYLPYPFAERECALRVCGGVWKGNSVAILVTDAPSDYPRLPGVPKGCVRCTVRSSGFQFFPIGSGERTLIKAVMNIDPNFTATPYWAVNYCSRHGVPLFIPSIRGIMAREAWDKSEFAHRLANGSKAYDILQERIDMKDLCPAAARLAEELEKAGACNDESGGVLISAGSSQDVEVPLKCAGDIVVWDYRTKCHTILFSVHFSPARLGEYGEILPGDARHIPEQVMEPVRNAEGKGEYAVPGQGVVSLRFDNSFSWIEDKIVYASIRAVPVEK